jgi:hypothetical protein
LRGNIVNLLKCEHILGFVALQANELKDKRVRSQLEAS